MLSSIGNSGRYIASKNVIITWSKDFDIAWGFSKSVGKWVEQKMNPLASGAPIVDDNIAVSQAGSTLYAFSGTVGRWDVLQLPADHKPKFHTADDYALVHDGEDVYTFAGSTGRWSSPQGKEAAIETPPTEARVEVYYLRHSQAAAVERILRQLVVGVESIVADERINALYVRGPANRLPEVETLLNRLDQPADPAAAQKAAGQSSALSHADPAASVAERAKAYEAKEQEAAIIVQQLRSAKDLRPGDDAALRTRLQSVVTQSFQLRQRLHEAELAHLAARTRGIEQTIQARQRIADQIIDRRVKDLLDPNLQWDQSSPLAPRVDSSAGASATPAKRSSPTPPRITYGTWFPKEAEKIWTALGVKVRPLTSEESPDPKYRGSPTITEVVEGGAEQGLRVGDIVVSLQTVGMPGRMTRASLEIRRGKETFPVTVEFSSAPPAASVPYGHLPPADAELATVIQRLEPSLRTATVDPNADKIIWSVLGVKVQTIGRKMSPNAPVGRGLLIDELRPDGPATQLRVGDIIVGLHDWQVGVKSELAWILLQPISKNVRILKPTARSTVEEATLYFLRNDEPHSIRVVLPPWPPETSTESGTPPAAAASPLPLPPPADLTSARAYRDKLRQRWEALEALYRGGKVRLEDILQDADDLGPAESAAAATPGARHAALKEHVERVKRIKSIVEDKYESEVEPIQNFLAAEAALIKAEAQLAASNRVSEGDASSAAGFAPQLNLPTPTGNQSLILRTAEEFEQRLRDAEKAVADIKGKYALTTNPAKIKPFIDRELREPERRLAFVREEYAAQIRLLELELHDAESAVAAAGKERDEKKMLHENSRGTSTEAREAQRAYDAAKLRLEKAKTLLDLYRKADPKPAAAEPPAKPDPPANAT